MNLLTAQISFLEPRLTLIHIPIQLYPFFVQPILRLLFGEDHDQDVANIPWTNRHDFLNISITPVECSIICSRHLADRFIRPHVQLLQSITGRILRLDDSSKPDVEISAAEYIVIQVDGQGLDAGQRVVELTSPLAMAGITLFFITTYFSDYILVPSRSQNTVANLLQQRGFVFSPTDTALVSELSPASPKLLHHSSYAYRLSPSSSFHSLDAIPSTPPAQDLQELQVQTFRKLKARHIQPQVSKAIRLFYCAGSREQDVATDERLKNDILQVLLATGYPQEHSRTTERPISQGSEKDVSALGFDIPQADDMVGTDGLTPDFSTKFLSLTLTANEPISVLLEEALLPHLGNSLLGAKSAEDALIPITLDLRSLPMDATTGIVCGLAGRMAKENNDTDDISSSLKEYEISPRSSFASPNEETNHGLHTVDQEWTEVDDAPIDISFLSTAKAGNVIVRENQLSRAMKALEIGIREAV